MKIYINKYLAVKVPPYIVELAENNPDGEEALMLKELKNGSEELSKCDSKLLDVVRNSPMYCENKVIETINRLENYPTDLSCYLTIKESKVATDIKNSFIEILKEGLL